LQNTLVVFRQRIPLIQIDEGQQDRTTFPPARIVVVRRNLVEAELLVIIGPDPLGAIDGALLESRINVATRNLLRNGAQLLQHATGKATDAEFEALEIVDAGDLL